MINFTSSDFNIVNFDATKSPEHLIVSTEKSNQLAVPIKATTTKKSQLAKYRATTDPGIGFGDEAAGARMNQPCYKEYAASAYTQRAHIG